MKRYEEIFGNPVSPAVRRKSDRLFRRYTRLFGDDRDTLYPVSVRPNPVLGPLFGVMDILPDPGGKGELPENALIIGTIRMGFGHYRISMAMASCARAMGMTPCWLDLCAFGDTSGGKLVNWMNDMYSLGSRVSEKIPIFNQLYWETLNFGSFRRLATNANDQRMTELMAPLYSNLPRNTPVVATHVWPAQAAVHAGFRHVINAIPDNMPLAFHLSEGAIHTVQTPSAYMGYKALYNMDKLHTLSPMPDGSLMEVGHYVDHELVSELDLDVTRRIERIRAGEPRRLLLTIGGAGAQRRFYARLIRALLPQVEENGLALLVNVGDHRHVWKGLCEDVEGLSGMSVFHDNDWSGTQAFASDIATRPLRGVHAFCHDEVRAAVYTTNLLIRHIDILATKPSELAFYPVPKLMIQRIGGHEAYGAIRAAEIGDGSMECRTPEQALQVLNLMLDSQDLLPMLGRNILRARLAGIYDGAYKAVSQAMVLGKGE